MSMKGSVLLVDDDPLILELLAAKLRAAGFRVTTAPDGMQAVIQATALKPLLIISDIQMPPWGTGPEALAEMRKVPVLQDVPVLFMTGMPIDEAIKLLPPDPLVRLIPKPLNFTLVQAGITQLLGECPPLN
jgi:CheY-like chemotaxis protein